MSTFWVMTVPIGFINIMLPRFYAAYQTIKSGVVPDNVNPRQQLEGNDLIQKDPDGYEVVIILTLYCSDGRKPSPKKRFLGAYDLRQFANGTKPVSLNPFHRDDVRQLNVHQLPRLGSTS